MCSFLPRFSGRGVKSGLNAGADRRTKVPSLLSEAGSAACLVPIAKQQKQNSLSEICNATSFGAGGLYSA